MSISTILMVLGAVAAFAYGIWAGLGQWRQSQDEIDRAMSERGRRRKATRHFTPLDLMARMTGVPTQRDRRNPFRFDQEERDEEAEPGESGAGEAGADQSSVSPEEEQEVPERRRSASQQGVDRDQDRADDGAQEVSEADDHP